MAKGAGLEEFYLLIHYGRSVIFLTGGILGDLLSAGGGLVLWTYWYPRLGRVPQNMD